MTRRVILVRHGNTFEAGETPVWVGARTDLPLTAVGRKQAEAVGAALQHETVQPDRIVTGPLRRTRETADIIASGMDYTGEIAVDSRLREIDYGAWEGRSNTDIDALGHAAERAAWDREAAFPPSPGWSPDDATLAADAASVLADAAPGTSVVVTSNGILRFFACAAANAADFPDRKVGTGHLCTMEERDGGWRIVSWNQKPNVVP